MTINIPLGPAFAVSHNVGYVVFLFSFVSKYFHISLVISSLIQWLLKRLLYNSHNFVTVPVFLLL